MSYEGNILSIVSGEAIDNEDLAGGERGEALQATGNMELLVLGEDDDGEIGHILNHGIHEIHGRRS